MQLKGLKQPGWPKSRLCPNTAVQLKLSCETLLSSAAEGREGVWYNPTTVDALK